MREITKKVPSWGSLSSSLALIGEAPGDNEVVIGRPFVGASGACLSRWWQEAGLRRRDFWIDNVSPYQGAGSKITNLPKDEVEMWSAHLWNVRLPQLTDVRLIVPTGNVALRTVMRRHLWANKSPKITDWRGSIFHITLADGRRVKCIPTIHPAATFSDPSLSKLCVADWKRIAEDVHFTGLRHPKYTHLTPPIRREWVNRYIEASRDKRTVMAIDIECPRREMACVGFSFMPNESLTLDWPSWVPEIKELCESPCIKVLQNALFDRWYLCPPDGLATLSKKYWKLEQLPKIKVRGPIFDLLAMHHVIDATLPHDLATMASLDTRQPYWKRSWGKDENGDRQDDTPVFDLMAYNGIDCCVERTLYDVYRARLEELSDATTD